MIIRFLFAGLILAIFCFVALFGLYLPIMDHTGHETGCLFTLGDIVLCSASLAYTGDWQSAFTAVLVGVLALFAFALVRLARFDFPDPGMGQRDAYKTRRRIPLRPLLFQELYSAGILNRKEPHFS